MTHGYAESDQQDQINRSWFHGVGGDFNERLLYFRII